MNGSFSSDFLSAELDPFSGPEILRVIPLTQSQIEIWLSCVVGGEQANRAYNESNSLRIKGALDVKVKTAQNAFHFTFTAHHLIIDGWSIGVVMEELGKLYTAYVQGLSPIMPSIDSFSEFAKNQNLLLKSPKYQEVEKFWLDLYKENVPVLDLPTDHPRPLNRTYKSSRLDHKLDERLVILA